MRILNRITVGVAMLAGLGAAAVAHAGSHQYGPYPTSYVEECGSCHVPYPPQRMTQADGKPRCIIFSDTTARTPALMHPLVRRFCPT